jgi:hypothetical protein
LASGAAGGTAAGALVGETAAFAAGAAAWLSAAVGVLPVVDGLVMSAADAADAIPKIKTNGINFFMWVAPQYEYVYSLL